MLRNVLDPKSASSSTAQLQRKRNYSDKILRYDYPHPAKAPKWAYNEQQDVIYDTEFEQMEGKMSRVLLVLLVREFRLNNN